MRAPLLLLSLCLVTGCAAGETDLETSMDPIVAGDADAVGFLTAGDARVCRATLVAADVVLTTASCIDDAEEKAAVLGFAITGEDSRGARATKHPLWAGRAGADAGWAHDIAYVVLDRPITSVVPAQLSRTEHDASCSYAGSGSTSANRNGDATIPLCLDAGYKRGLIHAFGDKGYLCNGDFGGPLRRRDGNEILGLASFMTGQCREGIRGYYTALAQNRSFVDEALHAGATSD
jgi:hypothetical protein